MNWNQINKQAAKAEPQKFQILEQSVDYMTGTKIKGM